MSDIVVGHALNVAETQGQHGLGTLQRLDMRLTASRASFVDAEDGRLVRWIEIQANNVPDLVDG